MGIEDNNLLINLNKWAKRQNENFTTEAFVHLLRHLRDREPAIASHLLSEMTNRRVNLDEPEIESLIINTQVKRSGVIPDIEIVAREYLIFVEVKVAEDLDEDQLERYQKALGDSGKPEDKRILILLSRIPSTKPDSKQANIAIRWYQIAEWLESVLIDGHAIDDISNYVINQFVEFLRGNNLILKPVKRDINNEYQKLLSLHRKLGQDRIEKLEELLDFPTLYSLLMMMDKVIDLQFKRNLTNGRLGEVEYIGGREYVGYEIQDRLYCFFICFYGGECQLVFMTWACKIDVGRFKGDLGRVFENAGPVRWQNELNLKKPGVHFFSEAKSPEDQIQIIDKFYRRSCEFVQQIIM